MIPCAPAFTCPLMPIVLTNAQTRFLRGQAHGLKAMLQVGGKGITDALAAEVDGALEHTGGSWEDFHRYCAGALGTRSVDSLIFYPLEDITTMMNLYKAGEVDATYNHTVPSSWIPLVRQYKDYQDTPEVATEAYVFNTTSGPTRDVRVRHALNMAIDKVALARFRRAAKPTTSTVPVGMFPGYPSPKGDVFDPEKAKSLLADAGFKDASGRYDPSTFPASDLEVTYNTSESNRSNAEFVQAQWKQNLGITVPLRNMEFRTFLQTRSRLEYRGLARSGWIGDYMDPFTFLSMYVIEGGENGSGWVDPKFEHLLSEANRQHDQDARYRMLSDAETLLLEAQPTLPLYNNATNFVKKPYVKGMYANPATMHAWKFVYIEHDPAKWD